MEIKSLSKLNSNEKTSIEQLVFICNTFDKSKSIPIIKKIIGKSNMKNTSDCPLLFI